MDTKHPLKRAISIVGLTKLAKRLNLSHQAVTKWLKAGRLPRSEWTGETEYAETIAQACDQQVTKTQLLEKWPADDEPDMLPAGGKVAATAMTHPGA